MEISPFISKLGVAHKEEVQMFYLFLESERSPKDDPLILWLIGGPGCSALSAFLYQTGPLSFNYANISGNKPTLMLNPYSWTKVANMIYLDSPVGTGFSYSTSFEGYRTGDRSSAAQLYEFLRKWLVAHPKFLSNPLYVGGDSYAGIVAPVVVHEISNGNDKGNKPQMNLKGFVLGNPVTHLDIDLNSRIPYAHQKGIIPDNLYKATKENCKGEYRHPDRRNEMCINNLQAVNETFEKLYMYNIVEPKCTWDLSALLGENDLLEIMRKIDVYTASQNSVEWCRDFMLVYVHFWANDKSVQDALHVREGTIEEWIRCNSSLVRYEFDVPTTLEYQRSFTKRSYRALIFSGDHDLAIPYVGTHQWIESLKLKTTSDWKPWFVEDQFAGNVITYSKKKYNLTYATVQEGGHAATEIRPKECFAMIDRWLAYNSL
ncbi:serine carboxypeptidase-like 18 isoform X2 [Ricinus communis]|uniref:serine carboxypeptidase-like 18 isoform X2 n=1 Tax=Ricinus communis TaxID=3988 RepID=UPI00201A5903|nr:serine carboxypeptidase-like 18 isoform X2 [Ricinus communis]